ncbi:MAG: S26 family signal peptidase [Candidatus Thermoplasmatota archaeon]|nr:S26 family signal peptidase [Candidatus Thermoplasmatota archaeon]
MDFKEKFKQFKNLFLRFWRSENNKVSLARDVIVALLFVFIILLALWTYTGQWFGAPLVAIESSSMQHLNEPFGRIGTINAGDMVLLVKVNSKNDVIPYSISNNYNYGKKGDVVIYHPDGNLDVDQIIHRAMCWIEVETEGSNTFYTIEKYDIIKQNASEPLYIPECGIWNPSTNKSVILDGKKGHYQKFTHSGFITKGDNPLTNVLCDQIGGISNQPVKVDWISGKASGELPWIGTINLLFNDLTTDGVDTIGNVPKDCLTCFVIVIIILISIPVSLDIYTYHRDKKQKKNKIPTIEEDTTKKL